MPFIHPELSILTCTRLSWQAFEKNHSPLSEPNRRKLSSARAGLKSRIKKHNKLAEEILGPLDADPSQPRGDALFGAGVRLKALTRPQEWDTTSSRQARDPSTRQPEYYGVDLPSSRPGNLDTLIMVRAGAYEVALRVAWMAHLLHEICLSLVVQVEIFRRTIKRTPGSGPMPQRERVQSSNNMREQYQSVRVYAQQYNVFRERMQGLRPAPAFQYGDAAAAARAAQAAEAAGAEPAFVHNCPEFADGASVERARYKELESNHILCDTKAYDVMNSHTFKLPWFWKLTARDEGVSDEAFVQDCESHHLLSPNAILISCSLPHALDTR